MVQRYASERKPIYKHAPWWEKNRVRLLGILTGITLFGLFGPMFYHIFGPIRNGTVAEFLPRNHDDVRQLRKRLREREAELVDSPYGKF